MTIFEKFIKEYKSYYNTLVILDFEVVLFLEIIEEEDDYYYVYIDKSGNRRYCTCVLEIYRLKNVIPDKQYNEMVRVWNLNYTLKAI